MKRFNKVLEIMNSAENLDNSFEDMLEISKKCKFPDCIHMTEPGCAVKKAISEGIISETRFNTYYRLIREAEYVSQSKNKTKAIDYMKKKKLFQKP